MRRAILGFAAAAPLVAIALWKISIPLAIGVVFVSHMLVLYPTLRARSRWLGPVVTNFATSQPELWLTIDDGPDLGDTEEILAILRRHGAKATFFVKGALAAARPELVRMIADEGHEIANHSHDHPSATFWCLPPGAIRREIDRCNDAIADILGAPPSRFRAPVGMKNLFVHPHLAARGMTLVAWSARGFDGVDGFDVDATTSRVLRDARPGAIVLLHQGVRGKDGSLASARCIERILEGLDARGLRCVIPPDASLS
ncbi:MAG: polysaccharide deacetylase family protein [Acidobacteria bacterium]|nr:polysaccharide deacetylase family protein [Acidobacteriota bacterium]